MSVNEGLVTSAGSMPRPAAIPLANTVLPAPRFPLSSIIAAPFRFCAMVRPSSKVASADEVMTSCTNSDSGEVSETDGSSTSGVAADSIKVALETAEFAGFPCLFTPRGSFFGCFTALYTFGWALLFSTRLDEGLTQGSDNVRRDHRSCTQAPRGDITRKPVYVDGRYSRAKRIVRLLG